MINSQNNFFVKTHDCNNDREKAIYIVRDGRRAIYSYYKWYKTYFPQENRSIIELLFGADNFLSWSEHINYWTNDSPDKKLIIYFNELINLENDTLDKISRFIQKPIKNKFINERVITHSPFGFREGKLEWEGEPEWSPVEDQMFWLLHGRMMQKMGFGPIPHLDEKMESIMELINQKISPNVRELYKSRNLLQESLNQDSIVTKLKKLLKVK